MQQNSEFSQTHLNYHSAIAIEGLHVCKCMCICTCHECAHYPLGMCVCVCVYKHFCIYFHFLLRVLVCSYLQPINTFARADNIDIDTFTNTTVYSSAFFVVASFCSARRCRVMANAEAVNQWTSTPMSANDIVNSNSRESISIYISIYVQYICVCIYLFVALI